MKEYNVQLISKSYDKIMKTFHHNIEPILRRHMINSICNEVQEEDYDQKLWMTIGGTRLLVHREWDHKTKKYIAPKWYKEYI